MAELKAASRNALSDSDFAYIDSQGDRHLPIQDAAHTKNAIARFNQTQFESHMAKEKAASKIRSAAKKFSIQMSEGDLAMMAEAPADVLYITALHDPAVEKTGPKTYKKELLRTGRWIHNGAKGGVLNVTKEYLAKLAENFKAGTIDNVFVPLDHPSSDVDAIKNNTGSVVGVELSPDGTSLQAVLEVKDPEAQKRIDQGLLKGISAGIQEDYQDKASGNFLGPVLRHAALVIEPYIKGLAPFQQVALSEDYRDKEIVEVHLEEAPMTEEVKTPEQEAPAAETPAAPEAPAVEAEAPTTETPAASEEAAPAEGETPAAEEAPAAPAEGAAEVPAEGSAPAAEEAPAEDAPAAPAAETPAAEPAAEGQTPADESPTALKEEVASLKTQLALKDADSSYQALLAEGKIVPAQKDAYIALKAYGASTVNLSDGTAKSVADLVTELVERQPKVSLGEQSEVGQAPADKGVVALSEVEKTIAKQLGINEETALKFKEQSLVKAKD